MADRTSRREFLITSAGVLVAASCGDAGVTNEPIGDPSFYPNSSRAPSSPMDTSMPVCASTAGMLAGPLASSLAVDSYQSVSAPVPLVIGRDGNGVFAVDLRCRHAGSTVAYKPELGRWVCPTHGSEYFIDGSMAHIGPTQCPLRRYPVCKGTDGKLYVDYNDAKRTDDQYTHPNDFPKTCV